MLKVRLKAAVAFQTFSSIEPHFNEIPSKFVKKLEIQKILNILQRQLPELWKKSRKSSQSSSLHMLLLLVESLYRNSKRTDICSTIPIPAEN